MKNAVQIFCTLGLLLLGPPSALGAGEFGYQGWGPRVGASVDPDQIFGGIHLDFGEIWDHIRFQPNVELGVGDDQVLLALNLEAAYLFPVQQSWMPYAGGGLGINFVDFDESSGPSGDGDDTDVGLNILGGVQRVRSGSPDFLLELKVGLSDSPDAKFTIGWTFGKPTHPGPAGAR